MSEVNLGVNIAGVSFKNPVMTASGTFGSGREFGRFVDLNKLGAIVCKGVSIVPWKGNNPPRVAETYGGMLNSVGLQNPGVEEFIKTEIPFMRQFDTNIIVNVCGHKIEEYCRAVEALNEQPDIDMFELNISCPNVSEGGMAFGADKNAAWEVVDSVKKISKKPLIVKLSPNVTDITEIARAVEDAGADAVSLINTLLGMKIDIHRRRPVLGKGVGGLSGPAVKPVAVRMVYQVAKTVKIPIIGMGGICTGEDAVEFLMAGATAVAVGTANFRNPRATEDVIDGVENFLVEKGLKNVSEIIGVI